MPPDTDTPHLLDTNIITDYRYQKPEVVERILKIAPEKRLVPAIVVWEILHGINKQVEVQRASCLSGKPNQLVFALRDLTTSLIFLSRLRIVPFDDSAYKVYQSLDKSFRMNKKANDAMIAAIGLSNGFVVATKNYDHFKETPGLKVADWRDIAP